jgi:hypothetical protein
MQIRGRREVVGQMLDYAANGPFYWTKDRLREFADETAARFGVVLSDAIDRLRPDEQLPVEEFFERVENNLREGQIRLVFFLEEAPQELKSVVDFLNKQMRAVGSLSCGGQAVHPRRIAYRSSITVWFYGAGSVGEKDRDRGQRCREEGLEC